MTAPLEWFRRLWHLLNRRQLEAELRADMEAHLEMMDPAKRARFGNQLLLMEQSRDVWGWNWLDNLVREYSWFEDEGEYRGTRSQARIAEEGDMKLEAMNNTAARSASLQEHLLNQWNLVEVDDETRRIGAAIIDYLSEDEDLQVVRATTAIQNYRFQHAVTGPDIVAYQNLVRRVPIAEAKPGQRLVEDPKTAR